MTIIHTHVLTSFGNLHAEIQYSDYDAQVGRVEVKYQGETVMLAEFDNPSERDNCIANALARLACYATEDATAQRQHAIENGFPH